MRQFHKSLLIMAAIFSIAGANLARADVGQIIGTILDEKSGEPLIGASVQLEGTSIGAAADIDGRYVIRNVPHGTHTLLVASLGYAPKRITEVAVTNGEPVMVDASLGEAVTELKPIEVTAERARATESSVLIKRRAAVNVTDGMSAEMIRKAGDANAGDALKRVVGVSVVNGRNLVVRGMGGRYSTVSLNGSSLPSPEPEKREVPLDLFPSGLLDDIVASKTFTPDKPGSFSGGSVDLATREFPSSLTYGVGVSRSYNSEATGDDMQSYSGGDLDWLGFDDGVRDLPSVVADGDWGYGTPTNPNPKNELAGESFSDQWSPVVRPAPWNTSFSSTMGNSYLLGETSRLGVLGSLNYNNTYKVRDNEIYREWNGEVVGDDYRIDRGTQSVLWGSLLNLTLAAGERNKISMKALYNRSADDEAFLLSGVNKDEIPVYETRLRFAQRHIATGQLSGEHQLNLLFPSTMSWKAQVATAGQNEPDTRTAKYLAEYKVDRINGGIDTIVSLEPGYYSGVHVFQKVDDGDGQSAFDWTIPMSGSVKFKTGVLVQNRTRYAETLRYRLWTQGQPPNVGFAEDYLTDTNIGLGVNQFQLHNLTFPDDVYDANEHTLASYGQLEASLLNDLKFVGGARYEDYEMQLHTGSRTVLNGRVLISRNDHDWMPMASLIYSISDRMNVRTVVSRTLTRPEFREMAPFIYQELASGRPRLGNSELKQTSIVNYDARWEYYPGPGEVVAVSVFAKTFENPIEQVIIGRGTSQLIDSYRNQIDAQNLGVEFEGRYSLEFLPGLFSRMSLGGNLTIIESEVTVQQENLKQPTEKRPLQGQSDWTANLNLGYVSSSGRTDINVSYNSFGDRLAFVDIPEFEDWYEQSRHLIDVTFGQKLGSTLSFRVGLKNVLGAKYQVTQVQNQGSSKGKEILLQEYEYGRTFSIGFSYGI